MGFQTCTIMSHLITTTRLHGGVKANYQHGKRALGVVVGGHQGFHAVFKQVRNHKSFSTSLIKNFVGRILQI